MDTNSYRQLTDNKALNRSRVFRGPNIVTRMIGYANFIIRSTHYMPFTRVSVNADVMLLAK